MKKPPIIQFIAVDPDEFIAALAIKLENQLFAKLYPHLQPKEVSEYLTIDEVCKLLKKDRTTIWRYTRDKILTAYQISNSPLYKRSEVEAVLMANKIS